MPLCCNVPVLLCPRVIVLTATSRRWLTSPEVIVLSSEAQRWGTADAEIKGPPGGNPGLSKVPSFSKPIVGEKIALHAVPAYRDSTYLVSAFPAHSTSFYPNFSNPQQWNVL